MLLHTWLIQSSFLVVDKSLFSLVCDSKQAVIVRRQCHVAQPAWCCRHDGSCWGW